jgi:hypothetical protein
LFRVPAFEATEGGSRMGTQRSMAAIAGRLGVIVMLGSMCAAGAAVSPAPAAAQVQQIPDSTFNPIVADPAFTTRHPRILFDEAHHNFHTMKGRYQAYAKLMTADGCVLTLVCPPIPGPLRPPFSG